LKHFSFFVRYDSLLCRSAHIAAEHTGQRLGLAGKQVQRSSIRPAAIEFRDGVCEYRIR
jgi:hypothetical protein